MKKIIISLLCSGYFFGGFAHADTAKNYLSFKGKSALEAVRMGALDRTQRLGDRTVVPYLYRESQVVPIVNSDTAEESRSYDAQVAVNAYGYVKFVKIYITKFNQLSAADQADLLKFYTSSQIEAAQGVVSQLWLHFQANQ